MFQNLVVVDARGHLLGRMASTIAKELLNGQQVVIVRCEEVEISGPIWRNQIKLAVKRHKKTNTNHKKGPFTLRGPAAMVKRVIRGMLPHKTARGAEALRRLKVFEGVPHPYDRKALQVIPEALRVLRLRPGRKFTNLGELAGKTGWKYQEVVKTLEERRKAKGTVYAEKKQQRIALRNKAESEIELPADVKATLELYGH